MPAPLALLRILGDLVTDGMHHTMKQWRSVVEWWLLQADWTYRGTAPLAGADFRATPERSQAYAHGEVITLTEHRRILAAAVREAHEATKAEVIASMRKDRPADLAALEEQHRQDMRDYVKTLGEYAEQEARLKQDLARMTRERDALQRQNAQLTLRTSLLKARLAEQVQDMTGTEIDDHHTHEDHQYGEVVA